MVATLAAPRVVVRRSLLLGVAAVLFVLYPALRPWGDLTPDGMAGAFGSPWWLVAHLAAMVGFVLVGFALETPLWWIGTALVLPYYGAEAFALHALADRADLVTAADAVRSGALAMTTFGVGLLLLAVAAVREAIRTPRAIPFAAAMVLFLPQFFVGPGLRIAHGVLLAVGLLLLAQAGTAARARNR